MELEISVRANKLNELTRFKFMVHKVEAPAGLLLEVEFYKKWSGKVPQGMHYEVEILEPAVWNHEFKSKIHSHRSLVNDRLFVCYPHQFTSEDELINIVRIWCVGTLFTMLTGENFESLMSEGDIKYFQKLEERHGIMICSTTKKH